MTPQLQETGDRRPPCAVEDATRGDGEREAFRASRMGGWGDAALIL
jgi:hypothetical protein